MFLLAKATMLRRVLNGVSVNDHFCPYLSKSSSAKEKDDKGDGKGQGRKGLTMRLVRLLGNISLRASHVSAKAEWNREPVPGSSTTFLFSDYGFP
jgi:hypothetical protein